MMFIRIIALVFLISLSSAACSEAGWLIYHEPEFKGKILDYDTKQPIEGAVVVAEYKKTTWWLSPHKTSSTIDVRETLTDKDGNFRFPSYTTVLLPISWQIPTTFTIFKPGYASISNWNLEKNLTEGIVNEDEVPWLYNKDLKIKFAPGLVGLPKLKTREERLKAMPSIVGEASDYKKQKELIRLLNSERRNIGLHGEY